MKKHLMLITILLIAAFFRFYNLNWDQNFHLHPDERFLTMVGTAMKLPGTFLQYLNPQTSTFNPANIGFQFYVYGTFPVVLNKILAIIFQKDNYDAFTLQGRFLSGLFDLMIVFLVYKTLLLFEMKYKLDQKIKYYGAFFYAIAVLPIQLSHFFAVDTFLNFFMFAGFYFILKFSFQKKVLDLMLSSVFLGIALASKITALFLLPLILFFIIYSFWKKPIIKSVLRIISCILLFGLISYLSLRISDPYLFQNNNFFDPRISTLFTANLKMLNEWFSPPAWYPPGVQWLHKTPIFPFANILFFGLGPFFSLFSLIGALTILIRPKRLVLITILIWVIVFSIFQSLQFAKTIRYFIIFYPYFAIFAAIGFVSITKTWRTVYKVIAIVIITTWTLAFFSIYTRPNTRVAASEWIYKNITNGNVILTENWDDGLPLQIPQSPGKIFNSQSLPVFDPDTPEKWQKMNVLFADGDYYILSSNRGWGSIPLVPERYPKMTKFYQDLFDEKTTYKKIKEFTSYPSLRYLGIPIDFPDQMADENFTVFDHPQVIIFKNSKSAGYEK